MRRGERDISVCLGAGCSVKSRTERIAEILSNGFIYYIACNVRKEKSAMYNCLPIVLIKFVESVLHRIDKFSTIAIDYNLCRIFIVWNSLFKKND